MVDSSSSSSAINDDLSFDGSLGREDLLPKTVDFEFPPKRLVGDVGDAKEPFKDEGPAFDGTVTEGLSKVDSEG